MSVYKMGFYELRTVSRDGAPYYLVVAHTIGNREVLVPSPLAGYRMRAMELHPDEVVLHEGCDLAAAQAFYDDCWSKVDNKRPETSL
ncbi:hypothetical protein [Bosea sp. AS-1]|uniref:hypothetical protein n=1 Tax=Bosea sp. AS-1 TaxID=2015316 RepID=UPI000B78D285|nr:hypothetical protein [Bosea sp. AS-1]